MPHQSSASMSLSTSSREDTEHSHEDHSEPVALTEHPEDHTYKDRGSRRQSTTSIPSVVSSVDERGYVIRSQRRGLFASLCLIAERENPKTYEQSKRSLILAVVAFANLIAPMEGSIYLPALDQISREFGTSTTVVNVSYGVYTLALGIFPLWWSSMSETIGRRSVYISSFTLNGAFLIGTALAPNIAALMVFRVLTGGCAASVQAVGAGTIADCFDTYERGRAMGYYYLGALAGPLMAPILGGLLVARWGWRSTMWFMLILSCVVLSFLTFVLPETLNVKRTHHTEQAMEKTDCPTSVSSRASVEDKDVEAGPLTSDDLEEVEKEVENEDIVADPLGPVISIVSSHASRISRSSRPSRDSKIAAPIENCTKVETSLPERLQRKIKQSQDENAKFSELSLQKKITLLLFIRPFSSFKLMRYKPVSLAIIYNSICFCTLYFINIGLQELYTYEPYNFGAIDRGLVYIPNSVGYLITSVLNGYYTDHLLKKMREKHGKTVPEARIALNVYFAATLLPISLLIFGWLAWAKTFWVFPLIGTFLFGIASMVVFGTTATYVVDLLPGRGSSGIALNNLIRMTMAAVATFVAAPLREAMGYGWLYTMLAILSALFFLNMLVLKRWGAHWRDTIDLSKLY